MTNHQSIVSKEEIKAILKKGSRCIAPLWSLENFVAVNPYLNMADAKFGDAMSFLNKSGNVQATLPVDFYMDAIRDGRVVRADIEKALEGNQYKIDEDVDAFIEKLHSPGELSDDMKIQTLGEVASGMNEKNWSRFMIDRISFWASAYFDDKQASWNTTDQNKSLFKAWKQEAEVDYAPEAMGLKGFKTFAKNLPDNHLEAAALSLKVLGLSENLVESYLSALIIKMNGWAGFAARLDWEAGLAGNESNVLEEFVTVMLVWEMGLKQLIVDRDLNQQWNYSKQECEMLLNMSEVGEALAIKLVLQEAFDAANQRVIINKINQQKQKEILDKSIPDVQAIFCIDVRSELFRRNLEATNHKIDTLGFAGFFAFPINYVPLAHDKGVNQCPVLLSPTHTIHEELAESNDHIGAVEQRANQSQIKKTWKTFKQSAISCFSFVSPLGLFFLPKLLSDSLGITRPVSQPDQFGLSQKQNDTKNVTLNQSTDQSGITGIPLEDRCKMAASA
ncbi:MAG: putative inorganic carbon transporter subunit DabA, partial [Ekhidna sp.]